MGKTHDPPQPRPDPLRESAQQKLERLIREQGVKPYDPQSMAGHWPEDFDPDEFLKLLANHRAGRRRAAAAHDLHL